MATTEAETLLDAALKQVKSQSIRDWVLSSRNKPIWLRICANAIKNGKNDPVAMGAFIVANAIGL